LTLIIKVRIEKETHGAKEKNVYILNDRLITGS